MKYFLVFLLVLVSSFIKSQDIGLNVDATYSIKQSDSVVGVDTLPPLEDNQHKGEIIYKEDQRFELLLKDYLSAKEIQGYRIQLFSGRSRWDAIKVKSDFLSKYEDHPIFLSYQQPNFKLRAGNFRDKLEAYKHLTTYKIDFPTAFIVNESIELAPLK